MSTSLNLDEMCEQAMSRLHDHIERRAAAESLLTQLRFNDATRRMHWRHDDLVCLFQARFRNARKQLLRAHYPTNPGERK